MATMRDLGGTTICENWQAVRSGATMTVYHGKNRDHKLTGIAMIEVREGDIVALNHSDEIIGVLALDKVEA